MKRFNLSKIAAAIVFLSASAVAMADGHGASGSGSISGSAQVGAQETTSTLQANLSATSTTSGNAVSSTKVYGQNGFATESTVSVGAGSANAGVSVTPSTVSVTTGQTSITNVVSASNQSANLPTLDNAGLLINGTAGVSQVQNNAAANVAQQIVGTTETAAIEGSAGIQGSGQISGY